MIEVTIRAKNVTRALVIGTELRDRAEHLKELREQDAVAGLPDHYTPTIDLLNDAADQVLLQADKEAHNG